MSVVIFTLQNDSILANAQFKAMVKMDTRLQGDIQTIIISETSCGTFGYIMDLEDFKEIVEPLNVVHKTLPRIVITSCNKAYASAIFPLGSEVDMGSMQNIDKGELDQHTLFYYRPDLDTYYVTTFENPDIDYGEYDEADYDDEATKEALEEAA